MSNIASSFIPTSSAELAVKNKQANQPVAKGGFDALLSSAEAKISMKDFADKFVENITRSLDQALMGKKGQATGKNAFPFSSEFESTFGSHGPLIDFINAMTQKLGLSAQQNKALQDIAVRNKDITHTPENIAKIAAELRQAGLPG